MIEIILLIVSWYVIGILSMLLIQSWIDKQSVAERTTWPGHQVNHDVGKQEVLVLGLCGPIVLGVIAYFVIVMWWLTRQE